MAATVVALCVSVGGGATTAFGFVGGASQQVSAQISLYTPVPVVVTSVVVAKNLTSCSETTAQYADRSVVGVHELACMS